MTLILEEVKKKYKAFELDCSLQLEAGRVTGLIGRNGAGKSTTFKAILGLISIDSGSVLWNQQPMKGLDKRKKEEIGVVLSESGFNGCLTVPDVAAIMEAMYRDFEKEKFLEKCNHFSISLKKQIKDFSTGTRAKLKILLAMSHGAKLLLLDEPTAGLDVIARDEILDMLRNFMENEEHSILISSHISGDLEGLCDDVYMIEDGKIILHEDTDVLLGEYGVLKVTGEQYKGLDKAYILYTRKEAFGYRCLTDKKQFYLENHPDIAVEKGTIDEVITLILGGERSR